MAPTRRLELVLDLEADADRPCGQLRCGERSWQFCGWLGLAVALERAIAPDQRLPHQPTPRPATVRAPPSAGVRPGRRSGT